MAAVDLLIQFAGFFLQTVPVSLLMGVSFDGESLRLPRRKTAAVFLVTDIICSLGFGVWETSMHGVDFDLRQTIANIYMTVFIIIMFAIFFSIIKAPMLNKLIVMIILIHYAAILFTVNGTILAMIGSNSGHI